jgi:hypothetical protein
MPTAFGYYTWPSISSYAFFFDKKTPRTPADINMTPKLLGKLYEEQRYYNESMYKNGYLKRYLIAPFKIRTANGFNAEQIETTYRLLIDLYLQKTCGATKEGINTPESYEQFVEKLSNPAITNNGVPAFLDKYNRIFQSFGTVGEAKNDLFKRMDIYSFGMIILNCVGSYLNYKQTSVIDEECRELMMKLYAFVYKCCDQTERVADINQLIAEYQSIVNPAETVAPDVVQLPEPVALAPPAEPLHRYLLRSMGLVRESPIKLRR